jgi:hypothetical protein
MAGARPRCIREVLRRERRVATAHRRSNRREDRTALPVVDEHLVQSLRRVGLWLPTEINPGVVCVRNTQRGRVADQWQSEMKERAPPFRANDGCKL